MVLQYLVRTLKDPGQGIWLILKSPGSGILLDILDSFNAGYSSVNAYPAIPQQEIRSFSPEPCRGVIPMAAKDFKRKLSAIFSADAVGYSRMMGEDEAATVEAITACREIMGGLIRQHRGRVVDSPGDNLLAEFSSVVDAVQCAVAVQKEFQTRNQGLPENRRMRFRIGINLGDIIEEDGRIYGDGVNIAARLEALADPGGICVSKTAFDHIETKLPLGYEYIGDQTVKNIARPVGAYRVLMEPRITVAGRSLDKGDVPLWRRKAVMVGGAVLILVFASALVWRFYPYLSSTDNTAMKKGPSVALSLSENHAGKKTRQGHGSTSDQEALSCAAKGLELLERPSRENNARAMRLFERAVELDPGYVWAWVKLAWTHLMAARYGQSPSESFKKAVQIVHRALELDGSDPDVHALLGNIYSRKKQYDRAISEGRRAISLDPTNAQARFLLATTMNKLGRFHEAISLVEEAMRLDPRYPAYYLIWLGSAYRMTDQYDRALEIYKRLMDRSLKGDFPAFLPHLLLAEIYVELDQIEKARTHAREVLHLQPRFSLQRISRVVSYGYEDPNLLELRVKALRKAGLR